MPKNLGTISHDNDITTKKYNEEHYIEKFSTMPTASSTIEGKIVQYIGTTTSVAPIYKHGHFYEVINTSGTYSWEEVEISSQNISIPLRENSKAYALQDRVLYPDKYGYCLICTTAGTSASSLPAFPTSITSGTTTITDGSAVWTIYDMTIGGGDVTKQDICMRKPSTAYAVGDRVVVPEKAGYILKCITAGTSGTSSSPIWPSEIESGVTKICDGGTLWWQFEDITSYFHVRTTMPSVSDTDWLGRPFIYNGDDSSYNKGHVYMFKQFPKYWVLQTLGGIIKYASDPLSTLGFKNLCDDTKLTIVNNQYVYKPDGAGYSFYDKTTHAKVDDVTTVSSRSEYWELHDLFTDAVSSDCYSKVESDAKYVAKGSGTPVITARSGWTILGNGSSWISGSKYFVNFTIRNDTGVAQGSSDLQVADMSGNPWDCALATACYESINAGYTAPACVIQTRVIKFRCLAKSLPAGAYIPITGVIDWYA